MLYCMENGKLIVCDKKEVTNERIVIINKKEELASFHVHDAIDQMKKRVLENDALRFEAHQNMNVWCIHLHTDLHKDRQVAIHIFLSKNELRFVCEHSELLDKQMHQFMDYENHNWTLENVLYSSLDTFLAGESKRLDALQDEITSLEDHVITNHGDKDTIRQIIHLRKRLLRQERCYEQMLDVLDHMIFNANKLLSDQILPGIELMSGHVDRMMGRVQTLQDYVTEIREAYQSVVDLNLNVTMRVFTVISAVFLPLTLIVGWYGMNLNMPEFGYVYAYPIVIVVSIVIVAGLLIYFKKNRWF